MSSFQYSFEEEEEYQRSKIRSAKQKRIKLIVWSIIAIILYYILWDYKWIRWTLILYIPWTLFKLIVINNNIKINLPRSRIDDLEDMMMKD